MTGSRGPLIGAIVCTLAAIVVWLLDYREALTTYNFFKPRLWDIPPGYFSWVMFFLALLLCAVAAAKRLCASAPPR